MNQAGAGAGMLEGGGGGQQAGGGGVGAGPEEGVMAQEQVGTGGGFYTIHESSEEY